MTEPKRIILGITGATGAIYALRMLHVLHELDDWETHLVISSAGMLNIQYELDLNKKAFTELADHVYDINNIAAPIASGSFTTQGMIVAPCSMKTLACIAHAFSDNVISRAADVVLKERRRLLVMPRETPYSLAHIKNMQAVTEMGGIIYSPVPAFYIRPQSIADLVDETVGRILRFFDIPCDELLTPWQGIKGDERK
ncbi:MAG TPA: UbiX family flavin prenyltransferase [Crenotrichaceae bacterium]|nr:UbiX family flavin prenyltransferase [Crenotrichaceae bacterium]